MSLSSLAIGITPTSWSVPIIHLSCFALRTDLLFALVGRNPHDYYHDSVTLALARLRPSRVPSPSNVFERDVGAPRMPLNTLIVPRPSSRTYHRQNGTDGSRWRRRPDVLPTSVTVSAAGHWGSSSLTFTISRRRCRTAAYTSSATPCFPNRLLSPRPFGSR